MNETLFKNQILPHIVAVVIFVIITLLVYNPIIFQDKAMDQNDINQGVGSGKEIADYRERTGEEPLWTNSMFGGMPAYLISVRWSGDKVIHSIQSFLRLYLPRPAGENLLAFISFYILLLVFGVRPYLAIAGALVFGLNTFYFVSIQAGHMWKVRAIAYMPLVLAGVHLVFKRKFLAGFILSSLAIALELYANHLQITYYLLFVLMFYGLAQLVSAIKNKTLPDLGKVALVLFAAGILGLGVNIGRIWSTYEYGKYSIRGKSELTNPENKGEDGLERNYAFRWSSGKWESFTLLIPHIYGGASGKFEGTDTKLEKALRQTQLSPKEQKQYVKGLLGYWGEQPGTAGPVYAGAIVCFLFILSFFFVSKKHKYWMVAAIILSIMLSWGKNFDTFNYLMFDLFPGYNKFRAVTMTIVIALMCIPLMSFMGLEKMLQAGIEKDVFTKILKAGGITLGLVVFAMLFTSPPGLENAPDWLVEAIKSDRTRIIRMDALRSIFYILVAVGLLYFYLKKNLDVSLFLFFLSFAIILDLYLVNDRYINEDAYKTESKMDFFKPMPVDKNIPKNPEQPFRVMALGSPDGQDTFNEARTSYYYHSLGGYHGAKIRRYSDIITKHLDRERVYVAKNGFDPMNNQVLNMLNTKYMIRSYDVDGFITNKYAYGNAWFVKDVKKVENPDDEINSLDKTDLYHTAVVDVSKFDVKPFEYDSASKITLTEYEPNYLKYSARSDVKSMAVFSEIYYPKGWKAFVDGKETDILRADYILRALELDAGEHTIEFRFEPKAYNIGNKIMIISSYIFLAAIFFGVYMLYRSFIAKTEQETV